MQNYEARKPSYFATPSPQLVHALHCTLSQILSRPLEERFAKHHEVSRKVKSRIEALGLKQLAKDPADQANGMTAIYLPEGVTPPQFLPGLLERGVIFAGGLHKEIATKYIRFGHMGVSVTNEDRGDIDRALDALEERLAELNK
jgi:alanine-glyoxylate transaminase/serine-glyoxylate transaminase/serine-pyruvate transaminase